MNSKGYTVLGWIVWQIGSRVAKRKMVAEPRQARRGRSQSRLCWWAASWPPARATTTSRPS